MILMYMIYIGHISNQNLENLTILNEYLEKIYCMCLPVAYSREPDGANHILIISLLGFRAVSCLDCIMQCML